LLLPGAEDDIAEDGHQYVRSSSYSQAAWLVTQSVTTTLLDDKNRTCTTGCWGEPGMTVCTRSGCAYDVLTATSSEKTF
jgi:hypothetical protein